MFHGPNLSDRLRKGTRGAQDAINRAAARFDLTQTDRLAAYLQAQAAWLRRLQTAAPELAQPLDAALTLLGEDLEDFDLSLPDGSGLAPHDDTTLARAYIWHSQQLAQAMSAKTLPPDGPGQRFLRTKRDAAAWRALCSDLETTSGFEGEAEVTVRAIDHWLAQIETVLLEYARS